jgi:hypothetical protein
MPLSPQLGPREVMAQARVVVRKYQGPQHPFLKLQSVQKYSDDQLRDEAGRWTDLGGNSPVRLADMAPAAQAGIAGWAMKNGVDMVGLTDALYATLKDPAARASGAVWYQQEFQDKAQALADKYGRSLDEVAAVIAITSAQTPWSYENEAGETVYRNLDVAENFLAAAQRGEFDGATTLQERIDAQDGLEYFRGKGFGEAVVGLLNGTLNVDEAVTGAKRRSFFDNAMDPVGSDEITNDTWMGAYLADNSAVTQEQVRSMLSAGAPKYMGDVQMSPAYAVLSEGVMAATERAIAEGIVPPDQTNSQTQATAWVYADLYRPAGRGARV